MARPPITKLGRTITGYPTRRATSSASSTELAIPPGGWGTPRRSRSAAKRVRSSACSMVSRSAPSKRDSRGRQGCGEVQGGLAAELHQGAERLCPGIGVVLGPDHREDALEIERLEVEARRGIEVGRDGLRVRVHQARPASHLPAASRPRGRRSSRTRCPARCARGPNRSRVPPGAPRAAPRAATPRPHTSSRSRASPRRTRRRTCRPWRSRAPGP